MKQTWPQCHESGFSLVQEVHVWLIFLQAEGGALTGDWERVQAGDEVSRAQRFFSPLHRVRFIMAHGARRSILAKYLACGPEHVRFSYGKFGKPSLAMQDDASDLRSNLSHSEDYALLAVRLGRDVGIDVEWVCGNIECEDIASMACSPCEITLLA
ncbi:4'-phosphopantetheinyl transferase family protein [Nitrospira sp. M1]